MKRRTQLVSNSSSSSFVLEGKEPTGCNFVILEGQTAANVAKEAGINWTGATTLYLTSFISDCSYTYEELINAGAYQYREGNHGGPYDEENFIKLCDDGWEEDVWISKEDYAEQDEAFMKGIETSLVTHDEVQFVTPKNIPARPKRNRSDIIKQTIKRKHEDSKWFSK